MENKPVRYRSLVNQVIEILSERIGDGTYESEDQLPPEGALADEFGVSRATIRRAFDLMEARGTIIRKQGVGSFVSNASKIRNPLDHAVLFQTMIKNHGCVPGVEYLEAKIVVPKLTEAARLNIPDQKQVLRMEKVFTADGEPVIYLVNTLPLWYFNEDLLEQVLENPDRTEPIFDFLEEECGQDLVYYTSCLMSESMETCPVEGYEFDPSEIAFVIDEIGHNQDDIPVLHSVHYYPGSRMKFEMIRRRHLL